MFNDPQAPLVTLNSPIDGANVSGNPALTCSATENNDLYSMTLFWDYGGAWMANDTFMVSGTANQSIFSHQLTSDGTYIWNCYACDVTGNCSFAPANYTFMTDITKPVVTLYIPVSQVYNTGTLNLNYDASDNILLDECWLYNSSSGMNYTLPSCQNATLNLVDGYYTMIVYANDSVNNIESDSVSFTVDLTNPAVSLDSPIDGFNSSSNSVTLYWTATDNLDTNPTCNVSVDDAILSSNVDSPNSTQTSATSTFSEGTHYWNITCWDNANRATSSATWLFTVDLTFPTIAFAAPTPADNSYLSANSFTVGVTHTEARPDTVVLYLSGNAPQYSSYSTGSSSFTTPALADGVYTYYVWLNDTAGNSAQTAARTITIDTTNPLVEFIASTPASDTSIAIPGTLYINISHTELNPGSLMLEVNGANETYSYTGILSTITKSYSSGLYNYRVYVNDSAGNINSTEMRNVTFFVPPPPAPPAPGSSFTGLSGGYSAPTCAENWNCTSWSDVCVDFEYNRVCTDLNHCGTDNSKPAESIACALASNEVISDADIICTPGEMKCSGGNVVICSADMTAWKLVAACEHGCENAACREADSIVPSGGDFWLTGMFVGQGANILMAVAGIMILIGGAYYYFRIRRFRVL